MTVINGIEIDDINYKTNDIKYAIKNNEPIENKLNVIIVVSNPCMYARRFILLKEFVKRIEEEEENINLFVVELVYQKNNFYVTDKNNKNHLQIKTEMPIWHKENMINLGVKYLLPTNWKAFAWIDADVEFDNNNWWMNRHDRRRADLKGVSSVRLLELNGLHEAEDEKMLIRLIKIRGCLWT